MNQKFKVGDVAMLHNPYGQPFEVKILECIKDDDGSWWYEVTPADWEPIGIVNREVPQKSLRVI